MKNNFEFGLVIYLVSLTLIMIFGFWGGNPRGINIRLDDVEERINITAKDFINADIRVSKEIDEIEKAINNQQAEELENILIAFGRRPLCLHHHSDRLKLIEEALTAHESKIIELEQYKIHQKIKSIIPKLAPIKKSMNRSNFGI